MVFIIRKLSYIVILSGVLGQETATNPPLTVSKWARKMSPMASAVYTQSV